MKNSILTICTLSFVFGLNAQVTIKGYVYEDNNANGKMDRHEKRIANVPVSNGTDVTVTDKTGKYAVSADNDDIIFVIKPSGYKTEVNENNLPQFYYIHKPNGSPSLKFEGVTPTGKPPKWVNFGLIPTEENENFKIIVFGDPQTRTLEEVDFFDRGVVSEIKEIKDISFGISLGDLVFNDLNIIEPYIKTIKKIGIPWYNVMGNHDLNFDVNSDSLSDETFERYFGPTNYAFNYGKAHFIILDDILYPDPKGERLYGGGFRDDQKRFIENNLKLVPKDNLIVIGFHIPLAVIREEDKQHLFNLLKEFPHTLSLSAHTHLQRQDLFTKDDGWKQEIPHHEYNVGTTSGSWYGGALNNEKIPISTMRDGTPKGYAYITFKGNEYVIDYKVADQHKEYRMNIFSPKVVPYNEKTTAGIYVNFFMGKEGDLVEYRVDEGKWKPMDYINDYDPAYLHLLDKWDHSDTLKPRKRLPNPVASTHLWRSSIPTNLKPGEHTIEVKVTDMFRRTFTETSTYRIETLISMDIQE